MKVDFVFDEGSSKEDAYLISKNTYGVFDGANSTNRFFDEDGRPGGLIAAAITRDEFAKNNLSLLELALNANKEIKNKMLSKGVDISDKLNLWCAQAAVIRLHEDSFEWLQIGDSLILVIYNDRSYKLFEENYDHDKKELLLWKKYADEGKTDIINLIRKELSGTRKLSNVEYGVLNGQGDLENFITDGRQPLENIKHILLFTDGLFIPKENPEDKDDFGTFVSLFLEGGLKNVKNHVRNLEKDDPECWKYPRFKQYDDIAAVSISF